MQRRINYQERSDTQSLHGSTSSTIGRLVAFWALSFISLGSIQPAAAQIGIGRSGLSHTALSHKVRNRTERPLRTTRLEQKVQQELSNIIRAGDEVWIINTRSAASRSCGLDCLDASTTVYQKVGDQFLPDTASTLIGRINEDKVRENVVFIHGNRTDYRWARLRGTQTYEAILNVNRCPVTCSFAGELPPVRWIIWSWPTDIIHGPKRDLAIKRQRAFNEGRLLAMFMQQVEQDEIGVLAYSLGAQALVSALCAWQSTATACSERLLLDQYHIEQATVQAVANTNAVVPFPADENPDLASAMSWEMDSEEWRSAELESETVIDVQESQSMMRMTGEATELTPSSLDSLLAGGNQETLPNVPTCEQCCAGPKLRIVMVAAAVPVDWFHSQMGRQCMKRCTASLTLINNPRDRVLEVYRKLTHLGPLGTVSNYSESLFPTIVHLVRNNALNNHVLTEYFSSEQTREQIRHALFSTNTVSK